jgi:putative transposase
VVLSTGQVISSPRPLDQTQRRLRRLNRQLARRHGPRAPDGNRRTPSAGWLQTRQRMARLHARRANVRRDALHKLTTELADTYGVVVIEDLNVAGMVRNRRLAHRIADAGFAELRRQLTYKCQWYGSVLVTADRWYPSSKTCSVCGMAKAKLPLSARVFQCDACGIHIDRDLNAAYNLAALVNDVVAGSGPETRNARGGDRRPGLGRADPREAGSRHQHVLGKTGTVGRQRPTTRRRMGGAARGPGWRGGRS